MTPRSSEGRLRVLLVEDEVLLAIDMQDRIERLGDFAVSIAGTVEKAHELISEEAPDAAFLDVNVKGKSSAPVARRLAREGVPCHIVSAYSSSEISEPELCRLPKVPKPVSDAQLGQVCERLLVQTKTRKA